MKKLGYIFFIIITLIACKNVKNNNKIVTNDSNNVVDTVDTLNIITNFTDTTISQDSIEVRFFAKYKMVRPLALHFDTQNLTMLPNILMPIPKLADQNDESIKASLLGIFTADMLYALNFKQKTFISQYYSTAMDYAYNLGLKDIFTLETIKLINSTDSIDTVYKAINPSIRKMFGGLYQAKSSTILPFLIYGFYLEYLNIYTNTFLQNKGTNAEMTDKFDVLLSSVQPLIDYFNDVMLSLDDFEMSTNIQTIVDEFTQINNIIQTKDNSGSLTNDQIIKIRDLVIDLRKNIYKPVEEKMQINMNRVKQN